MILKTILYITTIVDDLVKVSYSTLSSPQNPDYKAKGRVLRDLSVPIKLEDASSALPAVKSGNERRLWVVLSQGMPTSLHHYLTIR
jgi:hypothetical protein